MSSTTTYVAFRSSTELFELTDGFIKRMREGSRKPEPQTIERIMKLFIEEALNAFFIQPTEQAGLSGGLQRIVNLTADTIGKATHVVVKSTAKKLDIEQNRRTADYMESIRKQLDINGETLWHVAFPISDSMADKGRTGLQLAIDGDDKAAIPMMVEFFHELTDTALHWYFEEPMKLLGFGPIMRKVANVGVATTRKASHTAVDKIIPKLHGEELAVSARYSLGLLVEGPA